MSNPELDPFVEANACSTCPSNQFATTSNNDDLSCCAAIRVTDGTCTACTSADTSGCTAVSCIAGKGNADNDATTGCEVSCAAVVDGTCTSCTSPDASGCTAVTCDTNKFNSDADPTNGCESSLDCNTITAADATCTACSSSSTCTAVACTSGKGNADNDAANGCEVSCGTVTDGTCTACTTAAASDCTAVTCLAGKSNADNDATNGCEVIVDFLPVPDNCVINSDYHGGGEYNCNTGLKKIVNDWIAGGAAKDAVVAQYGPIETWNLAEATNLAYVFYEKFTFNADISQWIVSKVTNMEGSKYFLLLLFLFPCFIRI